MILKFKIPKLKSVDVQKLKNIKLTKKTVLLGVAVILAVLILFDAVAAAFIYADVFGSGGSRSFYEYAYGEKGLGVTEENKQWVETLGKAVSVKNGKKSIAATEITNSNVSNSYVLLCHQYGGSAVTMAEYAMHFYELGFNILLPDLRGFGENGYKKATLGAEDSIDILKWCDYIIEKDSNARIILFGVSVGGSAVAMAAGEELPDNVRAVIADSCYSDVREIMKGYIKNKPLINSFPTLDFASLICKIKNGWNFKDASVVSQAEKTSVPILYIHGENDEFAPISQSNDIYERCSSEVAEQVIIQEGTHARNLETDENTYWAETDAFILDNIGL